MSFLDGLLRGDGSNATQLQDGSSADETAVTLLSFTTSAVINTGVFLIVVLVFLLLRWKGPRDVMEPRWVNLQPGPDGAAARTAQSPYSAWLQRDPTVRPSVLKPPSRGCQFFADVLRITDAEVLASSGLDAFMHVQLLKLGLVFFLLVALVFACTVLLPLNATADTGFTAPGTGGASAVPIDGLDRISITAVPLGSPRLWVHAAGVWLFSGLLAALIVRLYQRFLPLRSAWMAVPQPSRFSVLALDLPPEITDDAALYRLMESLFPRSVHSVCLVTKSAPLARAVEKREALVARLHRLRLQVQTAARSLPGRGGAASGLRAAAGAAGTGSADGGESVVVVADGETPAAGGEESFVAAGTPPAPPGAEGLIAALACAPSRSGKGLLPRKEEKAGRASHAPIDASTTVRGDFGSAGAAGAGGRGSSGQSSPLSSAPLSDGGTSIEASRAASAAAAASAITASGGAAELPNPARRSRGSACPRVSRCGRVLCCRERSPSSRHLALQQIQVQLGALEAQLARVDAKLHSMRHFGTKHPPRVAAAAAAHADDASRAALADSAAGTAQDPNGARALRAEWSSEVHDAAHARVKRSGVYAPTSSGFVTFNSLAAATIATQVVPSMRRVGLREFTLRRAPEPRDVIWESVGMPRRERAVRQRLAILAVIGLVAVYLPVTSAISSLTTLQSLARVAPALSDLVSASPLATAFVQGYLPSLILSILVALVPLALRAVSWFAGVRARSGQVREVASWLFSFQLYIQFILFVVGAAVWSALETIIQSPLQVPTLLAVSLPRLASFFAQYLLLDALSSMPLGLLRIWPLIQYVLCSRWAATPRERRELRDSLSGEYPYDSAVPSALVAFVIGLTFSTLQPIIALVMVIWCAVAIFAAKHDLTYVNTNGFQTGGALWPLAASRLCAGLLVFQASMVGILALKEAPGPSSALLPLPILTLLFWSWLNRTFRKEAEVLPLDAARNPLLLLQRAGLAPAAQAERSAADAGTAAAGPGRTAGSAGDGFMRVPATGSGLPGAEGTSDASGPWRPSPLAEAALSGVASAQGRAGIHMHAFSTDSTGTTPGGVLSAPPADGIAASCDGAPGGSLGLQDAGMYAAGAAAALQPHDCTGGAAPSSRPLLPDTAGVRKAVPGVGSSGGPGPSKLEAARGGSSSDSESSESGDAGSSPARGRAGSSASAISRPTSLMRRLRAWTSGVAGSASAEGVTEWGPHGSRRSASPLRAASPLAARLALTAAAGMEGAVNCPGADAGTWDARALDALATMESEDTPGRGGGCTPGLNAGGATAATSGGGGAPGATSASRDGAGGPFYFAQSASPAGALVVPGSASPMAGLAAPSDARPPLHSRPGVAPSYGTLAPPPPYWAAGSAMPQARAGLSPAANPHGYPPFLEGRLRSGSARSPAFDGEGELEDVRGADLGTAGASVGPDGGAGRGALGRGGAWVGGVGSTVAVGGFAPEPGAVDRLPRISEAAGEGATPHDAAFAAGAPRSGAVGDEAPGTGAHISLALGPHTLRAGAALAGGDLARALTERATAERATAERIAERAQRSVYLRPAFRPKFDTPYVPSVPLS